MAPTQLQNADAGALECLDGFVMDRLLRKGASFLSGLNDFASLEIETY